MKYIRFKKDEKVLYGILNGDEIAQLADDFLVDDQTMTGSTYRLDSVNILPPVEPGKIIAIGLNYKEHAEESGKPVPDEPMMFMVSPSAVIGQNDAIKLPTKEHRIDYEAELAIVIGKTATHVKHEEALDYVFGYTINNDVSDRNLQKKDGQFTRAKSFQTFKPLGPVIENNLNPNNVNISLYVNGVTRQQSNTNDLIHDVESIIVNITEVMTLNPGDVILTGTPSGVAPLKEGDTVEIEIEGIGRLVNIVE
ncbi:fumarylacetoacetate hydrolase family protein [Psychrobacillus sp. NPDC093180]|uniref:fumarylacetoacetate hydrolase family protein n=1 Tax=Psychrobacillus sp. NPDC093180 TaxID=3364489 RepID=UPI00381218F4